MTTWLVDRDWATEFAEARRIHPNGLRVVCPFIKARAITSLLSGPRPQPLEVLTRFNLGDFARGVSDLAALRAILVAGGRVRGVRGLHAKVFIFGDGRAVVTSANLTDYGLRRNHEFGCVSDDDPFVAACGSYFDRLWGAAGADLTFAQVDEWETRVAAVLTTGGRPDQTLALPDHGAVVAADLVDPSVAEGWPAESGQAFVKFFGEGDSRQPWSFDVFEEVGRSGCHWACTYPRGRRPRQVRDGDTIFTARLVRDPNETLIFGRVIGLAHVVGRDDATDADIARREWKSRWPHYIRVHHGEFLAGPLAGGVRLSELMAALRADAFASTQRNQRLGAGNVNPRTAVRQQAAVRLSSEGAAWVNERLERAFELEGRIPAEQLAELDWPT